MSQAFISNYLHVVFSTKQRRPTIAMAQRARLWAYLGGIMKNVRVTPLAIGGMADHVHVLAALPSDESIARLVNVLKSNSSRWMNEQGRGFAWQKGYGAFSVSASNLAAVTRYIESQPEHHKKRDFEVEFVALLKRHGVAFDARYVFD